MLSMFERGKKSGRKVGKLSLESSGPKYFEVLKLLGEELR